MRPVMAWPSPHHAAIIVNTHCLLPGRYSRNTVVSKTKFPPPPNPISDTKNPSEAQLGIPPAMMAESEQIRRDRLNAYRRPTISAPKPQNSAPINMPEYTATVRPSW